METRLSVSLSLSLLFSLRHRVTLESEVGRSFHEQTLGETAGKGRRKNLHVIDTLRVFAHGGSRVGKEKKNNV